MTTTTRLRKKASGTINVALAPAAAFELFTPAGESEWAHGWSPEFLASDGPDDEAGTAFLIRHGGTEGRWLVTAADRPNRIEYARWTPDTTALITVVCAESHDGTTVTVRYDITSEAPAHNHKVQHFADTYERFLAGWQDAISAALNARANGSPCDRH